MQRLRITEQPTSSSSHPFIGSLWWSIEAKTEIYTKSVHYIPRKNWDYHVESDTLEVNNYVLVTADSM